MASPSSVAAPQAPIFYFFPPSALEAVLPAPRAGGATEDPEACARVSEQLARLTDPSIPILYVVPKALVTAVFPPFNAPPDNFNAFHTGLKSARPGPATGRRGDHGLRAGTSRQRC